MMINCFNEIIALQTTGSCISRGNNCVGAQRSRRPNTLGWEMIPDH